MNLGFYTYSYIDRLTMTIEPVLERIAATGYDGIDISATWHDDLDPALFPKEARQKFKRECERLSLKIEACVTHLPLVQAVWNNQPINLKGAADLAAELGAPIVTVHIGSADGREAEAWQTAVESLRDACAYAGQRGVVIALDGFFPGFLTDTPQKVIKLIEDVGSPHLKHNFDPCYAAVCGFDPVEAAKALKDHIVHVHVKDHKGKHPNFEHLIPGEGELDHAAWLSALKEIGFEGFVVVECFTHHPFERACELGYLTLTAAMAK